MKILLILAVLFLCLSCSSQPESKSQPRPVNQPPCTNTPTSDGTPEGKGDDVKEDVKEDVVETETKTKVDSSNGEIPVITGKKKINDSNEFQQE
jgi:hypothetical protein